MQWSLCIPVLLLGDLCAPAWAELCKIDQIKAVVLPNDLILTAAGEVYQPLCQDLLDPTDWRPGEKVVICRNYQGRPTDELFDLLNVDRERDTRDVQAVIARAGGAIANGQGALEKAAEGGSQAHC